MTADGAGAIVARVIPLPPDTNVLLVEDSPDDQLAFEITMQEAGLSNPLCIVEHGEAALDSLLGRGEYADRETYPMPGIVFMDINMPRVNGLEALKRIRAHDELADLPVVMITVSDADSDVIEAFGLGSLFYVRKPITQDNLRALLMSI